MSLALSTSSEELQKAINYAAHNNTLVFCTTINYNGHHAVVWPAKYAQYGDCFSVACYDTAKTAPTEPSDKEATYEFQGRAFTKDNIYYINDITHQHDLSGSSVATAVAAGVASLTLTCGRYANCNRIISQKMFIMDMFKKTKGGPKLLQPATIFSQKPLDQEGVETLSRRILLYRKKFMIDRNWI
ncbi:MAG: hypothetical protein FRX48_02760 [Lasallia pustulata]|uniref:Peptidase S8/S53 domain-containing protein n=1 Tax=Lasallia pustulata TaxID=136370 RepID=A0A5M8PVH7_9LECA|nr:MAG: hypothetical protein FRX48_02760 [Lasallia pustulata]